MAISTKGIATGTKSYTPEERKQLIQGLRDYHQEFFNSIKDPNVAFIPKMKFGFPPDRAKFFINEINTPRSLYVEWVSRDYIPEDNRNLYKYLFNPDFENYTKETDSRGTMYVVPSSQFVLVKKGMVEEIQTKMDLDFDIPDPDDCPLTSMTLRDFAALVLVSPVSRKKWLNELIVKTCQK